MKIWFNEDAGWTVIYLSCELDHHAAKECITEIGKIIDTRLPLSLKLDMGGVSFMDSSGLAVILSAHKRVNEIGGRFILANLTRQAEKIVLAAGLSKIFPVVK